MSEAKKKQEALQTQVDEIFNGSKWVNRALEYASAKITNSSKVSTERNLVGWVTVTTTTGIAVSSSTPFRIGSTGIAGLYQLGFSLNVTGSYSQERFNSTLKIKKNGAFENVHLQKISGRSGSFAGDLNFFSGSFLIELQINDRIDFVVTTPPIAAGNTVIDGFVSLVLVD